MLHQWVDDRTLAKFCLTDKGNYLWVSSEVTNLEDTHMIGNYDWGRDSFVWIERLIDLYADAKGESSCMFSEQLH